MDFFFNWLFIACIMLVLYVSIGEIRMPDYTARISEIAEQKLQWNKDILRVGTSSFFACLIIDFLMYVL